MDSHEAVSMYELGGRAVPVHSAPRRPAASDTQRRSARGMVTAELAVTTLAAFALLIIMCWGIYLIVTQVRLGDTAAAVARQAARDDRAATAKAKAAAPPGAVVTVERRSELVTVTVRVTAQTAGEVARRGAVDRSGRGRARAGVEPVTVEARRLILDQRGGASILMAGVMGVVVTISCVAMMISGYLLGYHRARAAADLAALSGAVAYQQGGNGCAEARRLAVANGARLADCDQVGDQVEFVITVRVAVAVELRVPGLPRTIAAEAHAGPVAQPRSTDGGNRPSPWAGSGCSTTMARGERGPTPRRVDPALRRAEGSPQRAGTRVTPRTRPLLPPPAG